MLLGLDIYGSFAFILLETGNLYRIELYKQEKFMFSRTDNEIQLVPEWVIAKNVKSFAVEQFTGSVYFYSQETNSVFIHIMAYLGGTGGKSPQPKAFYVEILSGPSSRRKYAKIQKYVEVGKLLL